MRASKLLRRSVTGASLILLMVLVLAAGCRFDAERQYNLRFPASLVLKNETAGTVDVNAILSSPEAEYPFALKGGSMAPAGSLSLRIAEGVYKDILAGSFVLRGACGDRPAWEADGRKLARKDVHDAQRWDVTVSISTCDP